MKAGRGLKGFHEPNFGYRLCRIPLCKTGPCWQEHIDQLNTKEWSSIYNIYTKFDIFIASSTRPRLSGRTIDRLRMQLPDWCAPSTALRTCLSMQGIVQGGNMNGSDAHPASMVNKIIWSCYVTLDSLISSPVLAGWASDPFMLPPCTLDELATRTLLRPY